MPLLDVEAFGKAGKLTPPQTLEWVRVLGDRDAAPHRPPADHLHGRPSGATTMANPGDNLGCPLWLAAYVTKAQLARFIPVAWQTEGLRLWQFTSTGKCPGIAGHCDLSRFDGPQAEFDALRL